MFSKKHNSIHNIFVASHHRLSLAHEEFSLLTKNETQSSKGLEKDRNIDFEIRPKMKTGSKLELDESNDDLGNGIASSWLEVPITKFRQRNSDVSAAMATDMHNNDELLSFHDVANSDLSNGDFSADLNAEKQCSVEKSKQTVPKPNPNIWAPTTGFSHFETLKKVFPERNLNIWSPEGRSNDFPSDHLNVKMQDFMENSKRLIQNSDFWSPNFSDFDNFHSELNTRRRNFMEDLRKTFPELNLDSDPDWWI